MIKLTITIDNGLEIFVSKKDLYEAKMFAFEVSVKGIFHSNKDNKYMVFPAHRIKKISWDKPVKNWDETDG